MELLLLLLRPPWPFPLFLMHAIVFLPCCCIMIQSSPSPAPTAPPPPIIPPAGNTTDHLALLSFKSLITHDPHGALDSWNDTLHFCLWRGVTCGGRRHPQRVRALDLDSWYLTGPISPYLANLTFLRILHLPSNQFHGHIPQELGRLSQLQHLNLSLNYLDGEIPANLSHCKDLQTIVLRNNMLQGEIPVELGSIPTLQYLSLFLNNLTGVIPPSLGNLSSLVILDLGFNSFKGSIPAELGNIRSLAIFSAAFNRLSGQIPPALYNCSSLYILGVGYNQLSGVLPPDIGHTLPSLKRLLMYNNHFEGPIPLSLTNASKLEELELTTNKFRGLVPPNLGMLRNLSALLLADNRLEASNWNFLTSLTNCSQLRKLDFSVNKFAGSLPNSIGNLSKNLEWIDIGNNYISGNIPTTLGNLINVTLLRMPSNLLTGTIPDNVGKLRSLQELDLSSNELSGELPSSLGNLIQLNKLHLNENNFEGNIPVSFGRYQNLELLDLSHNNLSGIVPKEVVSLSSLTILLDLSHNALIGSLPPEVGILQNLQVLNISENKLSGEIPSSLGQCQILEYLHMEGNYFQGMIPQSLSNIKGIQVIDLSRNNLSGTIPNFLASLRILQYLNLSFNNFEGEVPEGGVFGNASEISILGNNKLCGDSFKLHLPVCSSNANKRREQSAATIKIIISVISTSICLSIILCLLVCYKMRKSRKQSLPMAFLKDQYMKITYGELLKATDGFSSANLIGAGSFGTVYRGIMAGSEQVVAIKVFNLQDRKSQKSFIAECKVLRETRHKNLVKILTACSSIDFKGNDFMALVFEFLPNGSLEKWLHPGIYEPGQWKSLNFIQRLNIAIDVAAGLDYLHHNGEPIVHCDLKPSNILLDNDMRGVVGDFGLARCLSKSINRSFQNSTSSLGIKGSIGYIAPEYGMGGQISILGDVFSFGIVLLEMFTGKRPTDDAFKDGINLPKYVEMALPEQVMSIIDPHLLSKEIDGDISDTIQPIRNESGGFQECIVSVFKVGLLCSKELPKDRMEMNNVLKEMFSIREVFFGQEVYVRMV